MTKLQSSLANRQNLLVGALCATYGLFYFGRVNISVVLPLLAIELDVSRAQVGILGTVFFWTYAIGNFVNGEIGSHVSPYRVIGVGLLITAIVNLVFGFQTSLLFMLVLWGINGLAQSGGWPLIVRILAERLDPSRIKQVSTVVPFSYVIGTVVTWTLIGAVAAGENWRLAFWLPGLILLLTAALWWKGALMRRRLVRAVCAFRRSSPKRAALPLPWWYRHWLASYATATIIWLPTYILDSELIAENLVGAVAAITQLVAIPGILLARHSVVRSNRVLFTAALLLGATGFAFLLLTLAVGVSSMIVLCLAMMLLGGAFGLVTTSMPLILAPPGRASSVAGTLNMMATLAGGLAGFSIGALVDRSGWTGVFGLWGIMLLLASAVAWRRQHMEEDHAGLGQA